MEISLLILDDAVVILLLILVVSSWIKLVIVVLALLTSDLTFVSTVDTVDLISVWVVLKSDYKFDTIVLMDVLVLLSYVEILDKIVVLAEPTSVVMVDVSPLIYVSKFEVVVAIYELISFFLSFIYELISFLVVSIYDNISSLV